MSFAIGRPSEADISDQNCTIYFQASVAPEQFSKLLEQSPGLAIRECIGGNTKPRVYKLLPPKKNKSDICRFEVFELFDDSFQSENSRRGSPLRADVVSESAWTFAGISSDACPPQDSAKYIRVHKITDEQFVQLKQFWDGILSSTNEKLDDLFSTAKKNDVLSRYFESFKRAVQEKAVLIEDIEHLQGHWYASNYYEIHARDQTDLNLLYRIQLVERGGRITVRRFYVSIA